MTYFSYLFNLNRLGLESDVVEIFDDLISFMEKLENVHPLEIRRSFLCVFLDLGNRRYYYRRAIYTTSISLLFYGRFLSVRSEVTLRSNPLFLFVTLSG